MSVCFHTEVFLLGLTPHPKRKDFLVRHVSTNIWYWWQRPWTVLHYPRAGHTSDFFISVPVTKGVAGLSLHKFVLLHTSPYWIIGSEGTKGRYWLSILRLHFWSKLWKAHTFASAQNPSENNSECDYEKLLIQFFTKKVNFLRSI